jgi:hypothetical protein
MKKVYRALKLYSSAKIKGMIIKNLSAWTKDKRPLGSNPGRFFSIEAINTY